MAILQLLIIMNYSRRIGFLRVNYPFSRYFWHWTTWPTQDREFCDLSPTHLDPTQPSLPMDGPDPCPIYNHRRRCCLWKGGKDVSHRFNCTPRVCRYASFWTLVQFSIDCIKVFFLNWLRTSCTVSTTTVSKSRTPMPAIFDITSWKVI